MVDEGVQGPQSPKTSISNSKGNCLKEYLIKLPKYHPTNASRRVRKGLDYGPSRCERNTFHEFSVCKNLVTPSTNVRIS